MICGNRYRIYPNKDQKMLLEKHFGSCRFVYNKLLQIEIRVKLLLIETRVKLLHCKHINHIQKR